MVKVELGVTGHGTKVVGQKFIHPSLPYPSPAEIELLKALFYPRVNRKGFEEI